MKQENKQKISKTVIMPKAICFCPLGNDWYTNEFEIEFIPNKTYPDYCDIEKFLNENIRGKSLIIEDAILKIYNYLLKEYQPKKLKVISHVNDAISHCQVIVTKE